MKNKIKNRENYEKKSKIIEKLLLITSVVKFSIKS